ncbi:uncharacterized protein TNCV_1765581 [Trichonephila clavipes]|nr:uncharacterized protein TNCV_1765581 [Trichonephila clavipes]
MPVVSAPCSCQPDCLVCGRGDVPPHNCAIHVLLESMVFQEHMLYGEPTEERLEEILQNGKEYLPGAMHMTDQNSVRWQIMYHYVNIKTGLGSLIDMEAEHAFQVYLIQYQGVHLSDYITFMTQFRIIVNGLQPPEIIDLHTEQRIGELLTKVIIIFWTFFASEPLLVQNQRTCPVTT